MNVMNFMFMKIIILININLYLAYCPTQCACQSRVLHSSVDCSSLNLTNIPMGLPSDTTNLKLGFNNLQRIHNTTFTATTNLKRLWLNDNLLEIIDSGAFKYLTSLSWISLENNKLTTLHPDTFYNLPLFKLVLNGNSFDLSEEYPLLNSESLQILDMENCGLYHIPSNAFQSLPNLMTLRLGNNSLRSLSLNISSLSYLDLHSNSIGPTSNRLQLLAPNLLILDLSSCFLGDISPSFFQSFPHLEHINLADNIIQDIDEDAFNGLLNLQKVNLTNNLINSLPSMIFSENVKLNVLDIGKNPLLLQENRSFLVNSPARAVILTRCRLSHIPDGSLNGFANATELKLSNNKLQNVNGSSLSVLQNLLFLYIDGNKIKHLEVDTFNPLPNLILLDLSNNSLSELPDDGPFLRSSTLETLILAGCELETIPPAALRALPSLRLLNLVGNELTELSDTPLRAAPLLRMIVLAGNPWRCNCALRPLWGWCNEGEGGHCADAEETICSGAGKRRLTIVGSLECRENSEEELEDWSSEAEWLGAAGPNRPPPDRIIA